MELQILNIWNPLYSGLVAICDRFDPTRPVTDLEYVPGTVQKPFITVVADEINAIARDFPDLGTVMKDFYQLSDHTRMG